MELTIHSRYAYINLWTSFFAYIHHIMKNATIKDFVYAHPLCNINTMRLQYSDMSGPISVEVALLLVTFWWTLLCP